MKRKIHLTEVEHKEGGDYFLQVSSPTKALKESSMNHQFKERFEGELTKIKESIHKKGGVKSYEKVVERIGRAMQKYPSILKFYKRNEGEQSWVKSPFHANKDGVYRNKSGV